MEKLEQMFKHSTSCATTLTLFCFLALPYIHFFYIILANTIGNFCMLSTVKGLFRFYPQYLLNAFSAEKDARVTNWRDIQVISCPESKNCTKGIMTLVILHFDVRACFIGGSKATTTLSCWTVQWSRFWAVQLQRLNALRSLSLRASLRTVFGVHVYCFSCSQLHLSPCLTST